MLQRAAMCWKVPQSFDQVDAILREAEVDEKGLGSGMTAS